VTKDKFHEPLYFSGFQCIFEKLNLNADQKETIDQSVVFPFVVENQNQILMTWGAKSSGKTHRLFGKNKDSPTSGIILDIGQYIFNQNLGGTKIHLSAF
jgi:hypothetical protein